jgi:hypothetical protein
MIRALFRGRAPSGGCAREGPQNVFLEVDGKFGHMLSAGIEKVELARVATAVYDQLERK